MHEVKLLHEDSNMHKDAFARRITFARVEKLYFFNILTNRKYKLKRMLIMICETSSLEYIIITN